MEDELNRRFKYILRGTPEAQLAKEVCRPGLHASFIDLLELIIRAPVAVLNDADEGKAEREGGSYRETHPYDIRSGMPEANRKHEWCALLKSTMADDRTPFHETAREWFPRSSNTTQCNRVYQVFGPGYLQRLH